MDSTPVEQSRDAARINTTKMNQTKQAWRRPKTAPKDGTQFIADFGYSWPFLAFWNQADEQFVYSVPCGEIDANTEKTTMWIETERANFCELIGWLPMPKINRVEAARPARKSKIQ